jgi:hypothetical protein
MISRESSPRRSTEKRVHLEDIVRRAPRQHRVSTRISIASIRKIDPESITEKGRASCEGEREEEGSLDA